MHALLSSDAAGAAHRDVAIAALDALCAHHCDRTSGNLHSSVATRRQRADHLVQWCHGSPGLVPVLMRAEPTRYRDWAAAAAEDVWRRGVLTKGVGLCHGIAGNGYTFLALWRRSSGGSEPVGVGVDVDLDGDSDRWRARALAFAWAITQRAQWEDARLLHRPSRPASLYEGLAGGVGYLADVWAMVTVEPRSTKVGSALRRTSNTWTPNFLGFS